MALTTSAAASQPIVHGGSGIAVTPFEYISEIGADQLAAADAFVMSPQFGENSYLLLAALTFHTPAELDSDATPALTMSFGLGDSDGVMDVTIFADAAFGQGPNAEFKGHSDFVVTLGPLLDCSSRYIVGLTGTAADVVAAGQIEVSGLIVEGLDFGKVYELS